MFLQQARRQIMNKILNLNAYFLHTTLLLMLLYQHKITLEDPTKTQDAP
jgi:hypothetical protein